MNNCLVGAAIYHIIHVGLCMQIAICGQLIVSCKSSCRTQKNHHSIGVRPPMCNWRYTVPRLENCSTGGGGGAGWRDGARPSSGLAVTIIKNIAWLNKNQRDTDVTLVGGRGRRSPGSNLGYGGC